MSEAINSFPDKWLRTALEDRVGADQLAELAASPDAAGTLWDTVVASGALSDKEVLDIVAQRFRLKVADFDRAQRQAREIVPEAVARKYRILPLSVTDSHLEIATSNPFDLDCEKTLAFATGREVRSVVASPSMIAEKTQELYSPEDAIDKLIEGMHSEAEILQLEDEEEENAEDLLATEQEASARPVVRLVDLILSEGITSRASDIHIEPEEGGIAVRYRIDGVLRQVMKIPKAAGLPLISRIKIISGLDIADRLRPQDGRARVAVNKQPVDLRVSTLPASNGEKVVIRVLDSSSTVLALDSLGFHAEEEELIKDLLDNRDGIILVTGPTGSGKTTTLYSALRHVQGEGVNIVTVEDPVEYRLQGIVQVQVHEKAGLTFAAALRSILRQDPDVVLVGEIRDRETANIAIQASLTGHLVLSTLHTNDAPNAITRLVDIGIDGYKLGPALRGVVAQRLMRRLCPTCKEAWVEEIPKKLKKWIPSDTALFRAVGCPECAMTGYRGRFSIVEVLKVTPEIEKRVAAAATADKIAEAGKRAGMKSLWDSGLRHVINGESTIDELLRVVDVPGEDEVSEDEDSAPAAPSRKGRNSQPEAPRPAQTGFVAAEDVFEGGNSTTRSRPRTSAPSRPKPEAQSSQPPAPSPAAAGAEFELLDDFGLSKSGDAAGISVLLVDDEDQLRKVMKDLLERDGYEVFEAADGVEALTKVDKHAPDIIVLDLNLPNLDGLGVLAKLRSRNETAGIPVVVLTARGDEDNEVRVFEHGADDFLSKPFRAKALSARLKAVLGRKRAV